jgi:hypothetical protein
MRMAVNLFLSSVSSPPLSGLGSNLTTKLLAAPKLNNSAID